MRAFLIIDTEDFRKEIEVTNSQVKSLTPIIKKINKNQSDYRTYDSFELFQQLLISNKIDDEDITSINIHYHS